ncbi:MAG: FAD-binding protein [Candidatus Omnitrophica bacterium]|nr:FAD-binding protein [Candidatus Omnitrophota bacterium]
MKTKSGPDLDSYLEDTSNIPGYADVVYIPDRTEEIHSALAQCRASRIPFTVSAGRTGTTGAGIPQSGALCSVENLQRIHSIDPDRGIAVIEPGVSLDDLNQAARPHGYTLRAASTEWLARAGGIVGTCASGVRGFKYGSIRTYIRSLDLLLTTGESITIRRGRHRACGRKLYAEFPRKTFDLILPGYTAPGIKTQAGYRATNDLDLIDLIIGSEGTLGIITRIVLQLQKIPFTSFYGLLFLPDERRAFRLVEHARSLTARGILCPAALEYFDARSLEFLRDENPFIPASGTAVYFEQEIEREPEYEPAMAQWVQLAETHGADAGQSILADTPQERERIFSFRHSLPQHINEYLRQHRVVKRATDIAVPRRAFRQMYRYYKTLGEESGLPYVNFGHIGESHLHFNFLPRNKKEERKAKKYLILFCERAVALGGTVSAEHGIGKLKRDLLRLMYPAHRIREMAALKHYFDPHDILGLDTIFAKELLPAWRGHG